MYQNAVKFPLQKLYHQTEKCLDPITADVTKKLAKYFSQKSAEKSPNLKTEELLTYCYFQFNPH